MGSCTVALGRAAPFRSNNPTHLVLGIVAAEGEVGLRNRGYGGIGRAGARRTNSRALCAARPRAIGPRHVQLRGRKGALLTQAELPPPGPAWQHVAVLLHAAADDLFATCSLLFGGVGTLALDMVSIN